ncbi:MAG: hypothetical protein PHT19_17405, partial [Methylococcus sp.]|nr:hypothetical protein [Methylococcus sp.]
MSCLSPEERAQRRAELLAERRRERDAERDTRNRIARAVVDAVLSLDPDATDTALQGVWLGMQQLK